MFRILAIVLTLCVVGVLAAPFALRLVGTADRSERLLADGLTRAEEGDWAEARIRFEQVLASDSENLDARLGLARALRDGGFYEAAATHLLHIIGQEPDRADARLEFGEMLFMAGQMAESATHLDAIRALDFASPRVDALAAAHAAERGRDAEALAFAEAALAGDPSLSQAYATLAAVALRADDIDGALTALDRARDAGADTLSLGLLRLGLYEKTGRDDEIGAELAAMGDRFPGTPDLQLARARWLLETDGGSDGEVRDILLTLVRDNAGDRGTSIALTGHVIDLIGVEGARDVFGDAAQDPDLAAVIQTQIAALDMASGDRPAAIERLQREIDTAERVEDRNAASLLLARLLDPVEDLDRRSDLGQAVLDSDPENPSAHLLLSDVDLRRGDYDSAIAHLRSALTSQPEATDVILQLARIHALAGSTELAQDRLAKAVQTSGYAPELVLRHARLIEARQGQAAAAELIEIGLAAHPADLDLLLRRAQLALSLGDLTTARAVRARLAELDETAERLAALDQALAAQAGDVETVLADLEGDWAAQREEAQLLALGRAYLRSGNVDRALQLLDAAVEDRPDWVAARLLRADAHMATRAFDRAEADLATAASAAPDQTDIHAGLARLRLALNKGEAADEIIAAGLAQAPEDYELLVLKARRQEMAGDIEAAIAGYESLTIRQPGDPRVAARLGVLLTSDDRGEADLRRAEQLTKVLTSSSDPAFREVRAWVEHRYGNHSDAVDTLRILALDRPDDPVLLARLGVAQIEAGDVDGGRATLSRVAEFTLGNNDLADGQIVDTALDMLATSEESEAGGAVRSN